MISTEREHPSESSTDATDRQYADLPSGYGPRPRLLTHPLYCECRLLWSTIQISPACILSYTSVVIQGHRHQNHLNRLQYSLDIENLAFNQVDTNGLVVEYVLNRPSNPRKILRLETEGPVSTLLPRTGRGHSPWKQGSYWSRCSDKMAQKRQEGNDNNRHLFVRHSPRPCSEGRQCTSHVVVPVGYIWKHALLKQLTARRTFYTAIMM